MGVSYCSRLYSCLLITIVSVLLFSQPQETVAAPSSKNTISLSVLATNTSLIDDARITIQYRKGKKSRWKKVRKIREISRGMYQAEVPNKGRFKIKARHKSYRFKKVSGKLSLNAAVAIKAIKAETVSVKGVILYEHSRTPVVDVPLSIILDRDEQLQSNVNGEFSFNEVLLNSNYSLVIHSNTVSGRSTIQDSATESKYHEILISEALNPVTISGRVQGLSHGHLAKILLQTESTSKTFSLTSVDSDFSLDNIPPGSSYTISPGDEFTQFEPIYGVANTNVFHSISVVISNGPGNLAALQEAFQAYEDVVEYSTHINGYPMATFIAGTHEITQTIEVPSNSVVRCDQGTTLSVIPDIRVFKLHGTSSNPIENVIIENCNIEGDPAGFPGNHGTNGSGMIDLYFTKNVHVHHARLRNVNVQAGIKIAESQNVTIDHVSVTNFNYTAISVLGRSHNVLLDHNTANNNSHLNKGYGFQISVGFSQNGRHYPSNVTVSNNTCRNNLTHDCFDAHGGTNLQFINNMAINSVKCFDIGLKRFSLNDDNVNFFDYNRLDNILIKDNFCQTATHSIQSAGDLDYAEGIAVIGDGRSIAYRKGTNIKIEGNTVIGGGKGQRPKKRGGIFLSHIDNAVIEANTISESLNFGIILADAVRNFDIINNQLNDNANCGVYLNKNISQGNISDNEFKDSTSGLTQTHGLCLGSLFDTLESISGDSNRSCVPGKSYQSGRYVEQVIAEKLGATLSCN